MSRFPRVPPECRSVAAIAFSILSIACRSPEAREAARLARLRDAAAAGIEAADRYCEARKAAQAQAERGGPGADALIEQLILAPEALDDYCEHREHPSPSPPAPPPPASPQ